MENETQKYSILLEDLNEPLTCYSDAKNQYQFQEKTIKPGPTYLYGNPEGSQPVRIPLKNREIANPQGLIRLLEGGIAIFQDTALNNSTRMAKVASDRGELGRNGRLRTGQKTSISVGESVIYGNYRMTLQETEE